MKLKNLITVFAVVILLVSATLIVYSMQGGNDAVQEDEMVSAPTQGNGQLQNDTERTDDTVSSMSYTLLDNTESLVMTVTPASLDLSTKEVTLTIKNTKAGTSYYYDMMYELEYYDNGWKKVEFVSGYEVLSYTKSAEEVVEQKISFANHDFEFKSGKYRISKQILGDVLYAEFEITK